MKFCLYQMRFLAPCGISHDGASGTARAARCFREMPVAGMGRTASFAEVEGRPRWKLNARKKPVRICVQNVRADGRAGGLPLLQWSGGKGSSDVRPRRGSDGTATDFKST